MEIFLNSERRSPPRVKMHFHTLEMLVMVTIFVHADLLELESVRKCADERPHQCQNVNSPGVKDSGCTTGKVCSTDDLGTDIFADAIGKGGLIDSHPRTDNAVHGQITGCSSEPYPDDGSFLDEMAGYASNLVQKSYQQHVEHSSHRMATRGYSPDNEEKLDVPDQPVCTRIGVEKECDQDNEVKNDGNAHWFGSYISSAIQNGCRTASSIVEAALSLIPGCGSWMKPSDERNGVLIDEAINNTRELENKIDYELKKAEKGFVGTCKWFTREVFWYIVGSLNEINGMTGKKRVKCKSANIGSDKNKNKNLKREWCSCEAYVKQAACTHGSEPKGKKGKVAKCVPGSIYYEFMRAFEQGKHGLTMQELMERVASRGKHRGTQITGSKKCFNGCDEVQDVTKRGNFYKTVELALKMVSLAGVLLFIVALGATVLHYWTK